MDAEPAGESRTSGEWAGASEESPLIRALRTCALALDRAGVPFALAGSFAVHARGGPLPTHDVDYFILPEDRERAAAALAAAGMLIEYPPLDWLFKAWFEDCLVDLIHSPISQPVTPEMLARADRMDVAAVRMPVAAATDLVLCKMLTFSEHHCDFGSALPMARALREQVDWPHVLQATSHSPFAGAFANLLLNLDIISAEDFPPVCAPGMGRRTA
jgi:hypothetical protein